MWENTCICTLLYFKWQPKPNACAARGSFHDRSDTSTNKPNCLFVIVSCVFTHITLWQQSHCSRHSIYAPIAGKIGHCDVHIILEQYCNFRSSSYLLMLKSSLNSLKPMLIYWWISFYFLNMDTEIRMFLYLLM